MKQETKQPSIIGLAAEKKAIEYAIDNNQAVLLIGETGLGKTSVIRELAGKHKKMFRRLNLNGNTGVDEFVGKMVLEATPEGGTATKWQDGVLIDAMKKGHWLLVDEINAALPEVLFVLQSLLDDDNYIVVADNNGEIVRPHKDFRLFAAMNPPADYAGTKMLNRAFMSRFGVVVKFPTPNKALIQKILKAHVPAIDEEVAHNIARLAEHINLAKEEGSTDFFCSIRDAISLARLLAAGHEEETSFRMAVLNKADEQEEATVTGIAGLYFAMSDKKGRKIMSYEEKEKAMVEGMKKEMTKIGLEIDKQNFANFIKAGYQQAWEKITELHEEKKLDKATIDMFRTVLVDTDVNSMVGKLLSEDKAKEATEKAIDMAYERVCNNRKD